MIRRRSRELRAYRRVRVLRWALGALMMFLLGVQSMVNPLVAQADDGSDSANGLGFNGFKDFTSDKCVVVPQNIDGSFWQYYCPAENDGDPVLIGSTIRILDVEGQRSLGPYDSEKNAPAGTFYDSRKRDLPAEYIKLVEAQERWAGTTKPVGDYYGYRAPTGSRNPAPRRDGMGNADWYGPLSFTAKSVGNLCNEDKPTGPNCDPKKMPKAPESPCTFFTKTVGMEDRYDCRDPRYKEPCPKTLLKGPLLGACESDNKAFRPMFKDNWKDGQKDPCGGRSDGTSACDAGTDPNTPPESQVVVNDLDGVGNIDFKDNPTGWTMSELSKASATVMPWWILADDPIIAKDDKYQTRQTVDFLTRYTNVITLTLVVISVLVAGIRMVVQRDGSPAGDVARSLVTLVLVAGLGVTVVNYLVRASAAFSNWFIVAGLNPSTHGDFGSATPEEAVTRAVRAFTTNTGNLNFFVFLLAALFMIVGSIVQYFYMVIRFVMVITLTGTLAVAAAATNTEAGKDWFRKHVAYLAAFILAKPVMMIVFVSGARMWAPRYGGGGSATPEAAGGTAPPAADTAGAVADAASRMHAGRSGGGMQVLSSVNPFRGIDALGSGSFGGPLHGRVITAAADTTADMNMDTATQFHGLFIVFGCTVIPAAMARMLVPLVAPGVAGSDSAGLALATGAIGAVAGGAAMVGSAGMSALTQGAAGIGSMLAKGHQQHQFGQGKSWSGQAKEDWSSNWQANVNNNWQRTFDGQYQRHQQTFQARMAQRTAAGQSSNDAYQATYQETYQQAAASTWRQVYQNTYAQTWQQDEQRRNPGGTPGPAPMAPAQAAPIFAAAPAVKMSPNHQPPPMPSAPTAPGAPSMPGSP